uniref:Cadherin domain-containing protein n=1 Tax=Cyprinus carpio carpio TaxID=630221 RepID=A0A9J7ZDW9_CYPCA
MEAGGQRRKWECWWIALCFSLLLCFGQQVLAQIRYSIPEELKEGSIVGHIAKDLVFDLFKLDSATGEIHIKGELDFEETEMYKLDVLASDKGQPPWIVESVVTIKIIDINDNAPEIDVTSLSSVVSEDSKPGTVISLISISDQDSGLNGKTVPSVSDNVPFELKPSVQENIYSLVTKGKLDRELVSHYDITITVTDLGQPPLSSFKTLSVQVSDVNDNHPEFSKDPRLYCALTRVCTSCFM